MVTKMPNPANGGKLFARLSLHKGHSGYKLTVAHFLLIVLSMMDDRVMNWSKTCALVNSTHFSSGKVRW